jgi:hypothetical protein
LRRPSVSILGAALLAVSVASPLGVTPVPASAADAAVDLSGCLAPGPAEGDQRVFATSQGSTLTETVLDVEGWRGRGWSATVEAQLAAFEPTLRETYVKPGRFMLGDLTVGDLRIEVGAPEAWFPLAAVPGRSYGANVKGKAFRNGRKVGSARVSGDWQVVGFEPLTTPAGSYSDTVHISAARSVEVKQKRGPEIAQESDVEIWCVDGVGIVAASYAFRFFEDGELVGEMSDLDSWLTSATVGGVAVD